MARYYFVYIIECSDGTYYTGITNNLDRRFQQHSRGKNKSAYTYSRRPINFVWHEIYLDPEVAISVEKHIKKWSGQKKKALVDGDYDRLQ